jgi:hypothetical protein
MTKLIPLRNRKGETIANAIIDDADFDRLSKHKWFRRPYPNNRVYAGTLSDRKGSYTLMHQMILVTPPGFMIDHRNGNGLDNTRLNIRICTRSQNGQNHGGKSNREGKYKGVCFHHSRYIAKIHVDDKNIALGRFDTPEDAARAYDAAALEYFGEFAWLNFPQEQSI